MLKRFRRDQRGSGDLEAMFAVFLFLLVFAFGSGIVYGIYKLCCAPSPPPPPAYHAWLVQRVDRCRAMRSEHSFDKTTGVFECYRTPFMRNPKLQFKETWKGE